jgi:hypothetical protein
LKRARSRAARAAALAVLAGAALAAHARAQGGDRAIEFNDFGFDRPLEASARGAALSALAASARDPTALVYNPACLARVARVCALATFGGADASLDYTYAGDTRSAALDEYALQFVGGAVPVPVVRGSLVPAAGIQRVFSSALDISYRAYNTDDDRDDALQLHQAGATYAFHLGMAADVSDAFSAGVDFMVFDGGVDRTRQYDTRGRTVDPNVHTFVYEDTDADVGGVGARFGLLFYAFDRLQLGLVVTTPLSLTLDATTVTEETRQVDNDVGTFTRETTQQATEYETPYRLDGALGLPLAPSLLVTAQVGYSDWALATIDGERLITTDLQDVMRTVLDLRAGVEWTSTRWPLRVRAGFAHARASSAYLEADRIDNDQLEPMSAETASTRVALGAGYLARASIVIEAAVAYAENDRSSRTVGDGRAVTSVSLGCGYWF